MALKPREELTRFDISDIDLLGADGYTKKDFDTVINRIIKGAESSTSIEGLAFKVKRKIDEVTGETIASIFAPTKYRQFVDDSITQVISKLPPNLTYKDAQDNPLKYLISSSDLGNVSYFKTVKGKEAREQLKTNLEAIQGVMEEAGTKKNPDRVRITIPSESLSPDVVSDLKKQAGLGVSKLSAKEQEKRDEQAQKEREKEEAKKKREEEQEKHKAEAEEKRRTHIMLGAIAILATGLKHLIDITRRILSNMVTSSIQANAQAMQARALGNTYATSVSNRRAGRYYNIGDETIDSAAASMQSKFGNVDAIDEASLALLARVMGDKVTKHVRSGLGESDPQALMEMTADAFFKQIMEGRNSLGENVGVAQARREMITLLQRVDPNLAKLTNAMVDANLLGQHAGQISNYQDFIKFSSEHRLNVTSADLQEFAMIGGLLQQIKASFSNFLDDWKVKVVNKMLPIVDALNNLQLGLSDAQKLERTENAIDQTREALTRFSTKESEALTGLSGYAGGVAFSSGSSFKNINWFASEQDWKLQMKGKDKATVKGLTALRESIRNDPSGFILGLVTQAEIASGKSAILRGKLSAVARGESITYEAGQMSDEVFDATLNEMTLEGMRKHRSYIVGKTTEKGKANNLTEAEQDVYFSMVDRWLKNIGLTEDSTLTQAYIENSILQKAWKNATRTNKFKNMSFEDFFNILKTGKSGEINTFLHDAFSEAIMGTDKSVLSKMANAYQASTSGMRTSDQVQSDYASMYMDLSTDEVAIATARNALQQEKSALQNYLSNQRIKVGDISRAEVESRNGKIDVVFHGQKDGKDVQLGAVSIDSHSAEIVKTELTGSEIGTLLVQSR